MTNHLNIPEKKYLKTTLPRYESNPSSDINFAVKKRKKTIKQNGALIVTDSATGELDRIAERSITFIEEEECDEEQFIKLYALGIKQLSSLSKGGFDLFKVIYKIMLENHNQDTIFLDYNWIKNNHAFNYSVSRKTYIGALNDLLKNEIVFQSTSTNMFFINLKLFYNGDRINIVKSYKRKSVNKEKVLENQQELLLE